MTSDELDAVKRQVDAWQPRTFDELKTLAIPLPGAPARPCPPMG